MVLQVCKNSSYILVSFQEKMVAVVDELKSRGVLKEEEGRMVMFPTGCEVS